MVCTYYIADMVLKLNGSLEHDAHVLRETNNLISLRHLFTSTVTIFFFQDTCFQSHVRNVLPPNIGTMIAVASGIYTY